MPLRALWRGPTPVDYDFKDSTHATELTGDLTKCSHDEIAKAHIQPATLNKNVNRHLAKFIPGLKALSNPAVLPNHVPLVPAWDRQAPQQQAPTGWATDDLIYTVF